MDKTLRLQIIVGILSLVVVIGGFAGITMVEKKLGTTIPTVVALFSTTLASEVTSTATSMTLTSGTDEDGNTISGTYGFVIDEGTSSEEFVLATCDDTACTSMTRGVSVVTGNTAVTALKSAHARGASVKISDHPQLAIVSRILNGDETFPNLLNYATSAVSIAYDYSIPTKKYVDDTVSAGAPDASTAVKGIVEEATDAELAAGTAAGGTLARLFANGASFTQTPTASKVPVALATGLLADGWLGLTTAGDMCYSDGSVLTRLALGTSGYFLTAGASAPAWTQYANLSEANTAFGSTDISGAELEDLSDGGATTIHSHAVLGWKNGTITRDMTAANGAVNTAHGLGRTPIFVRITGVISNTTSVGVYNGTTTSNVSTYGDANDSNNDDRIIHYTDGSNAEWATVAVDATNITLTWTKANNPTGTLHIMWEAY